MDPISININVRVSIMVMIVSLSELLMAYTQLRFHFPLQLEIATRTITTTKEKGWKETQSWRKMRTNQGTKVGLRALTEKRGTFLADHPPSYVKGANTTRLKTRRIT